ncbi:MAG: P-loop containing nucleoside triphosphate hydrolase protein, partial [Olpidium bornovanus]
ITGGGGREGAAAVLDACLVFPVVVPPLSCRELARLGIRDLEKAFEKTEDDMKALQSVGQIVGEVLKQLDEERCKGVDPERIAKRDWSLASLNGKIIVKASSGPRYVVGCRNKVDKAKLKQGTRVALDMTTLTIMRMLPREVDPLIYNMSTEDPGNVSFAGIGGLTEQIRELREVIELPLVNPELFLRVGIKPPKGVLLYGPPGTGKTLLARATASSLETNFLKVVSSAIVDKYIGESARLIREMFGYAREHEPCIIFMDEIDAIGGRRFSEGTSADREIQRTLMEVKHVFFARALSIFFLQIVEERRGRAPFGAGRKWPEPRGGEDQAV